mgnify:CR=1 FL=1
MLVTARLARLLRGHDALLISHGAVGEADAGRDSDEGVAALLLHQCCLQGRADHAVQAESAAFLA